MPATRHRDASNARVFSTYCCCAAPPMNRTTTPLNDTTPTSQTVSPGSVMERYQLEALTGPQPAGVRHSGASGGDRAIADIVQPDRAVLMQRHGGCLGDPTDLDRVGDAAWARDLAGDDVGEGDQLLAERVGKSIHEKRVWRAIREGAARFGGADRPVRLDPSGNAVM